MPKIREIPPRLKLLQEAVLKCQGQLWIPKGQDDFIDRPETEPLLTFDREPEKLEPKLNKKALKLRIVVTPKQKEILDNWFIICTGFYNLFNKFLKTVISILKPFDDLIWQLKKRNISVPDCLKTEQQKAFNDVMFCLKWENTRDMFKNVSCKFKVNRLPQHTIDNVAKFICAAYNSSFTRLGSFHKFNVKNQHKNRNYKVIEFDAGNWNQEGFLYMALGELKIKNGNKYINIEEYRNKTCFIRYNKHLNHYNLIIIVPWDFRKPEVTTPLKIAGVDLGVRTFASVLNEQCCLQYKAPEKIKFYMDKIDKIRKSEHLRKYKKVLAILKCNRKIRNHVDNMHWQIINKLVEFHDVIAVGNISAKQIASRTNNRSNNRMMHALAYTTFRERLKYKCLVQDKLAIIVDEAYTSKTCSDCSYFNKDLGASKLFVCPGCSITIDRDYNACRNIIFKCLE